MNYSMTDQISELNSTPNTERTLGVDEIKNQAGGFTFKVSPTTHFRRFLVIGNKNNNFYSDEKATLNMQAHSCMELWSSDPKAYLNTLIEVSDNRSNAKNDYAIFALAYAAANRSQHASDFENINDLVRVAFQSAVRNGTHLLQFVNYADALGAGWGRFMRNLVSSWYTRKTDDQLAYQFVKYKSRGFGGNTWNHMDVLRSAHTKGIKSNLVEFVRDGSTNSDSNSLLIAHNKMKGAYSAKEVASILSSNPRLPKESIPNELMNADLSVWMHLLENGQLQGQGLVRNLNRLFKLGVRNDLNASAKVARVMEDSKLTKNSNIHPMNVVNAYAMNGANLVGTSLDSAMNKMYHDSFANIVPANKRTLVALDTSGSMLGPYNANEALSPMQLGAAFIQTIVASEPMTIVTGFARGNPWGGRHSQPLDLKRINISGNSNLGETLNFVPGFYTIGTDCSLPILYAMENDIEIDTFIIYTDNDVNTGSVKPFQALKQYRKKTGIPARLAVIASQGSYNTIADPNDSGMMDFEGFDSNGPKVIADFSAGRL